MGRPDTPHAVDSTAEPVPARVVFVDDDASFLAGLRRVMSLHKHGWPLEFMTDPSEALRSVTERPDCVVVTDWNMAGLDGPALCERIRAAQTPESSRAYLILLTGRTDPDSASEGLERGADDFLKKPVETRELIARIRVGMRLLETERRLRSANARLSELAETDGLTGFYNRRHGANLLDSELQRVERDMQSLAVMLVDVDHFKQINDTHGHGSGDQVLVEISRRLEQTLRTYDSIVRWGGDEFLAICPFQREPADGSFADRVVEAIATRPVELADGRQVAITCSGGVAIAQSGTRVDAAVLVERADSALYEAKDAGRGCARSAGVLVGRPGELGAAQRG